jgi:hypothetical protein
VFQNAVAASADALLPSTAILTTAPEPEPETRPTGWTLADVVDFEHFLAAPEAGEPVPAALLVVPHAGLPDAQQRRDMFRAWLDLQRRRHAGEATPGERLQRGETLLRALAWGLGLAAGTALAGAWLAQGGQAPVNAPLFWAATVGLQLLLLVLAGAGWAWRRRLGAAAAQGGWLALLQGLIAAAGRLGRRLPGERREALRAALGRLAMQRASHGSLLAWPAVALAQRLAVAFNLGLLLAMLVLHLPLVDLRFGWQSTYPVSAQQVHAAVQGIATPWRWALPQAQPSAADVAATRYAPGQPAHSLPADAARAWWPFLALSVATYGLLLRGALLLWALRMQRRLLARWRFDQSEANALWRRLAGAPVQAAPGGAQLPAEGPHTASTAAGTHSAGPCVALVAQELALPGDALAAAVQQRLGGRLLATHGVAIDDRAASAAVLAGLASSQPQPATVLVLAPAGRDPIVAVALFLRAVLQAAGPHAEVLLVLSADGAQPAALAERVAIWQRFVQAQRLRLGVQGW